MREIFWQLMVFGLAVAAVGFIGWLVVCHVDHVHCRLRILEETRESR